MTKYEWEKQLKKGISGLPKAEQQRVLDYYNELFADKIDAGLREQYIISEFGNPYDVANKILVDFYNGDKENPEVDAYIYADSDDIDDAFDEQTESVVETPKRKTFAERRDEKRAERIEEHNEQKARVAQSVNVDAESESKTSVCANNGAQTKQNVSKGTKSASGLVAVLCVLIFFVLGACFNLWHPAWLIFLLMPTAVTLIQAINRRNWRIFAYPVFVTFCFLVLGFYAHAWHPAWVIFLTIPVYYVLGDFISKNVNKPDNVKQNKTQKQNNDDKISNAENGSCQQTTTVEKSRKSKSNTNAVALIAKILMAICLVSVAFFVWGTVICMFVGGVGMVIGGIGCIAGAFVGAADWLLVGAGIAVLGLGLICAFGMAALFKPCFDMCRSFAKTIKNSFDGKEVA